MKPEAKEIYSEVKECFQSVIMKMEELKQDVLSTPDTKELVDMIYALRETYKYADDLRKEIERLRILAARIGVVHCDAQMIERVQTDYCSGTPKETSTFNYPHKRIKDPERYDTLMQALGIPFDVYSQELVRIHWPEFQRYCQRLLALGKNPPAGIDPADSNPVYDFSIRKKKEIDYDQSTTAVEKQAKQEQVEYVKDSKETPF